MRTLFALLMGDSLFLRVNAALDREAVVSRPFSCSTATKRVAVASFYTLPEELLDDPDALLHWARDAIAAARVVKSEIADAGRQVPPRGAGIGQSRRCRRRERLYTAETRWKEAA